MLFGIKGYAQVLAQSQLAYPKIFEYVPIESPPRVLNYETIRKKVGYPLDAIKAGIEGKVFCRVLVDESGKYLRHRITRADHPALGKAVDPYVHLLTFAPAHNGGQTQIYWANVRFDFYDYTQHYELTNHTVDAPVKRTYKKWDDQANFFIQEGKLAISESNHPSALRMLSRAVALCKAKSKKTGYEYYLFEAYAYRSQVWYAMSNYIKAIEDLTEAIGIAQTSIKQHTAAQRTLPELYQRRATNYHRLDKPLQALNDLQWIDKFYPCTIPYAKAQMVELMLEVGDFTTAQSHIEEIVQCEYAAYGNDEGALQAYAKLLSGIAAMKQEDFQQAFTLFEAARALEPTNPLIYFYKGLAIWELGGTDHACQNFVQALAQGLDGKQKAQAEVLMINMDCNPR